MISLYRLVTFLIYLLIYPWAHIQSAGGDLLWMGRLGRMKNRRTCSVWLHAASAGETRVISYLIHYLLRRNPALRLHLTVMTRAGFNTASRLFDERVSISFFPLDAIPSIRMMLRHLKPRMIVIAETEIWPCLISEAFRSNIELILVNGRMTERSFRKYRMYNWTRGAFSLLLSHYERFFFKSESDRKRYAAFGVAPEKQVVAGDMKFDAPLIPRSAGRRSELRHRFGMSENDFVWVAGSTRPGEEAMLLDAYDDLSQTFPRLRLILVPRHIDRIADIILLLQSRRIEYRSFDPEGIKTTLLENDRRVLLIDQMGLMNDLYLAADIAFVGGTLADFGGHNLLEPIWAGTPVLFGPYIENVTDAAEYIKVNNFGRQCDGIDMLNTTLRTVLENRLTFVQKNEEDIGHSPTALVGDFILERLRDY